MSSKWRQRSTPAVLAVALLVLAGCEPVDNARPTSTDNASVSEPIPLASAPPVVVSDLPSEISAPIRPPSDAPLPAEGDTLTSGQVLDRLRARLSTPTCIVGPNNTRWRHKYAGYPQHFADEVQATLPMMLVVLDELESHKLPGEFALIPIVESWYRTDASSFGAAGMWQMIAETARNNGATVTGGYDGRLSALDSTDAALTYLGKLHGMFNDWRLTAMAYNSGEYRLMRTMSPDELAQRSAGGVHYRRPEGLSWTTYEYVSKMRALTCLLAQPERQGIPILNDVPVTHWIPYTVPADIDSLDELASRLGTDSEALKAFNRGFRSGRIASDAPRMVLVPASTRPRWESTAVPASMVGQGVGSAGYRPAPPTASTATGTSSVVVGSLPALPVARQLTFAPPAPIPAPATSPANAAAAVAHGNSTTPAATFNTPSTPSAPAGNPAAHAAATASATSIPANVVPAALPRSASPAASPVFVAPAAAPRIAVAPIRAPAMTSPAAHATQPATSATTSAGTTTAITPSPSPAVMEVAHAPAGIPHPAVTGPASAVSGQPVAAAAGPGVVPGTATGATAKVVSNATLPTRAAPVASTSATHAPGSANVAAASSVSEPASRLPPPTSAAALNGAAPPVRAGSSALANTPVTTVNQTVQPAVSMPSSAAAPGPRTVQTNPTPLLPSKPAPPPLAAIGTPANSAAVAAPRTHKVALGDSLEDIAAAIGVSVTDLRAWNHLPTDSKLFVDQVLKLEPDTAAPTASNGPRNTSAAVVAGSLTSNNQSSPMPDATDSRTLQSSSTIRAPESAPGVASPNADAQPVHASAPRTYKVRYGDSLEAIEQRFNVSDQDLRSWNHMSADAKLLVDQVLQLEP